MAWKNILDMRRAVDLLVSLPEVESEKVGCYGHSMGSTHTWLVGPWEPRLEVPGRVTVVCRLTRRFTGSTCCTVFRTSFRGLFEYGDTPDIAGLIAPRALHMNFGDQDGGSPIDEVRAGVEVIQKAYESMHAEDKFSYFIEEETGHVLSDEMWRRTKEWFARHLA